MTGPGTRAALTAIASYLPAGQLTNAMLEQADGDWPAEKIAAKTGISNRFVAAPDEFSSDIAVRAAERLFAGDPARREGIDFVLVTTLSPDYIAPVTAALVQDRLGLPKSVGGMDITLGCSGYTYALTVAAGLVESGRARKVLLLTADRFTQYTDEAELSARMIFGDGGTANLVEAVPEGAAPPGGLIGASDFGTDGTGAETLIIPTSGSRGFLGDVVRDVTHPTVEMKGPEVFDFTIKTVAAHLKEFLAKNELQVDDVDLYVFHQANLFMLEHLRRRMGIPKERFALRIADVGNTLSSSIPLALEQALADGRVGPGSRVLLLGFGVGLSWGSVLLQYPA